MRRSRARAVLTFELFPARLQQDVLVSDSGLLYQFDVVPNLHRWLQNRIRKSLYRVLLLSGIHFAVVWGLTMWLEWRSLILNVSILGLIALLLYLFHRGVHHFCAGWIHVFFRAAMIFSGYTHIANLSSWNYRRLVLSGQWTLHWAIRLLTMIVFI